MQMLQYHKEYLARIEIVIILKMLTCKLFPNFVYGICYPTGVITIFSFPQSIFIILQTIKTAENFMYYVSHE